MNYEKGTVKMIFSNISIQQHYQRACTFSNHHHVFCQTIKTYFIRHLNSELKFRYFVRIVAHMRKTLDIYQNIIFKNNRKTKMNYYILYTYSIYFLYIVFTFKSRFYQIYIHVIILIFKKQSTKQS